MRPIGRGLEVGIADHPPETRLRAPAAAVASVPPPPPTPSLPISVMGGGKCEDPAMDDLLARPMERELLVQAMPSLFSVEVSLKHLLEEDDTEGADKYKHLSSTVARIEGSHEPLDDAIEVEQKHRMSTGFSIAKSGNILRILTCAHTLSDIYTARKHRGLTVDAVSSMFRFDVVCSHQEHAVLTSPVKMMPSKRHRYLTPASLIALDTELDLLVLEVDVRNLLTGKMPVTCGFDHPPIRLAELNPAETHKIVLVGWPPQRASALAVGQVSHCDWTYDQVTSLNIKGYRMKLLEVHKMTGGNGFSGGPCVTTGCSCVGVYHGIFNESNGYAVSLQDVKTFLKKNEILTCWNEEEEDKKGVESEASPGSGLSKQRCMTENVKNKVGYELRQKRKHPK